MGSPDSACPVKDFRKLPLEERYRHLDQWSDEQMVSLYRYHCRCMGRLMLEQMRQSAAAL